MNKNSKTKQQKEERYTEEESLKRADLVKCALCKKTFRLSSGRGRPRKYCSIECTQEARRRLLEAFNRKRAQTNRERLGQRKCEICNKEFTPRDSRSLYCSAPCRKRGAIARQRSNSSSNERETRGK